MQIQRFEKVQRKRGGFTLLEMLIVLAIILVIAAMVVPNLLGRQKKANIEATKGSIHGLEKTLELYSVDNHGEFPSGNQDEVFASLMQPNEVGGEKTEPYLTKLPVDAWGELMYYEYPNTKAPDSTRPAIWSAGPNHQNEDGSGDDINNWDDTGLGVIRP